MSEEIFKRIKKANENLFSCLMNDSSGDYLQENLLINNRRRFMVELDNALKTNLYFLIDFLNK